MKRNAVPMIYPGAGKSSKGGIGQIRFVLRVGLPIVQLDINVARRDRPFCVGDPDLSKVLRATQSAKALDAISGGVEEIDPGAGSIRVQAARRQSGRGREHFRRVVALVQDVIKQPDIIFSSGGKRLLIHQIQHRFRRWPGIRQGLNDHRDALVGGTGERNRFGYGRVFRRLRLHRRRGWGFCCDH